MKYILVAWFCWKITQIVGKAETRFYYENTSDFAEQIMAPSDWDLVDCDDPATCVRIRQSECESNVSFACPKYMFWNLA